MFAEHRLGWGWSRPAWPSYRASGALSKRSLKRSTFTFSFLSNAHRKIAVVNREQMSVPINIELECFADTHAPSPAILALSDVGTKIDAVLLAQLKP